MPEDSKPYQPLVDQLREIIHNGDETILRKPVSLYDLLPKRTSSFYRYFGSVSTPACQEIVIWTIFDNPIHISEKQASLFDVDNEETIFHSAILCLVGKVQKTQR